MAGSNERRIVLLGKTGSGKSSLGNTILGDSLLKVKLSPESETSKCQKESKIIDGIVTTVIDTPGFFDTNMSEEKLKPEVVKCIKECAPGPDAFVIVLPLGRYSDQEKEVINKALEYFSEEALEHAVIVFTHGDDLDEEMKIEDFVSKSKDLSDLVKRCGGGCHVVDNKHWNKNNPGDYRSNRFQVKQLLNIIDKMKNNIVDTMKKKKQQLLNTVDAMKKKKKQLLSTVDEMRNNRGYYTNEMLQAVEKNQWDSQTLLKMFAGATVGALLGALFGTFVPIIPVCAALIGGAVVGGAVGYGSSTVLEAVKNTTDVAKTVIKVIDTFHRKDE